MSSDPPAGRAATFLGAASACLCALLLGCMKEPARPAAEASGRPAPMALRVRVINPRLTPRSSFDLVLGAETVDATTCRLRARLQSLTGGPATLEFVLSEDVAVLDGALKREFSLAPGEDREETLMVVVPEGTRATVGVVGGVAGGREEAFAEFGAPPTAGELGIGVRARVSGEKILRIPITR
jgi:hypothetical protein